MTTWPAGFDRIVLEQVDSTNLEARRRASEPLVRPLWIAARQQAAGRGRLGRPWETLAGNLAATLLTSHPGPVAEAARLWSFAAPLAASDLVARFAPSARVAIKWPNDVLLEGGKVAGILIENLGPGPGGRLRIAVGIGVNLATHPDPEGMPVRPTSLARETGKAPDFEEALEALAERVAHWQRCADAPEGYKALLAAWRARLVGQGHPVTVRLPGETVMGTFEEIDEEGRLLLRAGGKLRRIAAGDVYLAE